MGLKKSQHWIVRLPVADAQQRIAEAMRQIGMDVEEEAGTLRGKAARSLRQNRWAADVVVELQAAEHGATASTTVNMAGNKHSSVLAELAEAIGPDVLDDASAPRQEASSLGAPPTDVEQAITQLAQKLNVKMLVRKELRKLPSMLHEHETIVNFTQGRYEGNEGLIVATDRRVMFIDEGIVRSHREDFPYERISSVQCSTGMLAGKLTIFASGNKAELDNIMPKQQATALADYVRNRISPAQPLTAPTAPTLTPTTPRPNLDAYERLRKLGELRDSGLITPEEFEKKKSALLEEM
jgi:hypothetical protein